MTIYIFLFLIFAFLGWLIDSIYCSIGSRKFVFSGYFKNVPLCPIYGFGGLIILNMFIQFQPFSTLTTILSTLVLIVLLEYIGGWFCDKILQEKLWDYSKYKYNINGYINLLNSFYWLILIIVLYLLISPHLSAISLLILKAQNMISAYDVYLSSIFIISALGFTMRTKDRRLTSQRKIRKLRSSVEKFSSKLKEKIN